MSHEATGLSDALSRGRTIENDKVKHKGRLTGPQTLEWTVTIFKVDGLEIHRTIANVKPRGLDGKYL